MEITPSLIAYVVTMIIVATTPNPFSVLIFGIFAQSVTSIEQLGVYIFWLVVSQALAIWRAGGGGRDDD